MYGDPRSDLYAVDAVGYYRLTGLPVFEAASVAEVFALHLQAQPLRPSQRKDSRVPWGLEAVIMKCLSKKVSDYPASAGCWRGELRRHQRRRRRTPPTRVRIGRDEGGIAVMGESS